MVEFGAWLSLVERLVRDQEVRSSNLRAPTNYPLELLNFSGPALQLCAVPLFKKYLGPQCYAVRHLRRGNKVQG